MSFSWFVYTPLTPKEALAVEDRLRAAIAAFLETHPGLAKKGGEWGDVTVGEAVPSADDVAELAEAYDRTVSEDVLDRLDACKSALEVERNGTNELDGLQVSILHWLLDNLPPCLVDWGDFQIVASEDVRGDIAEFDSAGDLANPSATASAASGGVALAGKQDAASIDEEGSDVMRSSETSEAIEAVSEDPFLQKRFAKLLDKYPEYVKNYLKLIDAQGPMSDEKAADALGMPVEKLAKQLVKLHDMATGLAGEADEE